MASATIVNSGAMIQLHAVFHFQFWLFCAGNMLVGVATSMEKILPRVAPLARICTKTCLAYCVRSSSAAGQRRLVPLTVRW